MKKAEERWDNTIQELEEKKVKVDQEHERAAKEFAKTLTERAPPEMTATIEAATVVKAGTAVTKAAEEAKMDIAQVEQLLRGDQSLQCLPELSTEQSKSLASSVLALVDARVQHVVKRWQPIVEEEDESEEEELGEDVVIDGNGGFEVPKYSKQAKKKKDKALRKQANASASSRMDTTTERKPAETRKAEDQGDLGRVSDEPLAAKSRT